MKRLELLDLWRSLAFFTMLLYHGLYDLCRAGLAPETLLAGAAANTLRLFTCCSFILLAGISSRFSSDNRRRGAVIIGAGVLVMAASVLVGNPVLFGILQLLGVNAALYGFYGPRLARRVSDRLLLWSSLALFFLTWLWTASVQVQARWLWPLGFLYDGFYSADFYPILPWSFLFLAGTALGGFCRRARGKRIEVSVPAALCWPGRHSLLLYLLHQPVLYGLLALGGRFPGA